MGLQSAVSRDGNGDYPGISKRLAAAGFRLSKGISSRQTGSGASRGSKEEPGLSSQEAHGIVCSERSVPSVTLKPFWKWESMPGCWQDTGAPINLSTEDRYPGSAARGSWEMLGQ